MTEPPVDPALFRLRTFEESWIPLLDLAAQDPLTYTESQCRGVVAVEIRRWWEMGRTIGYFPDDEPAEIPGGELIEEQMFFHDSRAPDPTTFASMLGDAREDLTPARLRFIELFLFADDRRWALSLGRLHQFAETLRQRPRLHLDPTEVDQLAWALHGAEPSADAGVLYTDPDDGEVRECVSPAAWRIALPTEHHTRLLSEQRFLQRGDTLELARAPIMAILESILIGQGQIAVEFSAPSEHGGSVVITGRGRAREIEESELLELFLREIAAEDIPAEESAAGAAAPDEPMADEGTEDEPFPDFE